MSRRIWWDMVRMLPENRPLASSSYSGLCSSSALVVMTVSGVFSSWEAAATNCRCRCQATSTGLTAHRESRMLISKNTKKLMPPRMRQVVRRLSMVAISLEISANTTHGREGVSMR